MAAPELLFELEQEERGGFSARAVGHSIFTLGETWGELQENVRDAVRCHFDEGHTPGLIHLRLVRDEVIAVGVASRDRTAGMEGHYGND
jgi:hypothetical protein